MSFNCNNLKVFTTFGVIQSMNFIRRKLLISSVLAIAIISLHVSASAIQEKTKIAKNTIVSQKKVKSTNTSKTIDTPAVSIQTNTVVKSTSKPNNSYLTRIGVDPAQTKSLTLSNAIRLALQNNNDIEVARSDVKIAESSLRSLLGFYDPVFTVSPKYTNSIQPQPSTLGGADLSGVTRSNTIQANANFNQPVKQGGGNFSVFFNNTRNSTSSSFSQLNPIFSTNVGISFTQPLFRNRKIDPNRRQIKIQRKVVAQSDADFRRKTIEIVSNVQRAYWDLVFTLRDQQNRLANLNLTKENLRQIDAKISAGSAAPLQRAEVSTELANRESDLLVASQQVSIAENSLKRLLLKDLNSTEWSNSFVPTDKPIFSSGPIDLNGVTRDAISNRPELRRLKLQNEINKIDLDYFKNQIKPKVDLTTSYTMIGLSGAAAGSTAPITAPIIGGNPLTNADAFLLSQLRLTNPNITVPTRTITSSIPPRFVGGYGKSLSNLFRNKTRTFEVGVTFSFPLRNKTAKANLATAEFQKQRIAAQTRGQEQVVLVEVRNAVQSVDTARKRVLTSRRARENAEIQLNGERKLYNAGRSTTFLLFQRENALTNSRNAEIRAETDYNKALADLQKATSTTFRVNNIVVDSPTKKSGT